MAQVKWIIKTQKEYQGKNDKLDINILGKYVDYLIEHNNDETKFVINDMCYACANKIIKFNQFISVNKGDKITCRVCNKVCDDNVFINTKLVKVKKTIERNDIDDIISATYSYIINNSNSIDIIRDLIKQYKLKRRIIHHLCDTDNLGGAGYFLLVATDYYDTLSIIDAIDECWFASNRKGESLIKYLDFDKYIKYYKKEYAAANDGHYVETFSEYFRDEINYFRDEFLSCITSHRISADNLLLLFKIYKSFFKYEHNNKSYKFLSKVLYEVDMYESYVDREPYTYESVEEWLEELNRTKD